MQEAGKTIIRSMEKAGLAAALAVMVFLGAAPAGAFTGTLTDMQGQPVDYPTIPITLRVYTAASGGELLWEEVEQVAVANGAFTIEPGQGETTVGTYDESLLSTKCNWFELECDGDLLGPRQEVSRLGSSFEVEGTFFVAAAEGIQSTGTPTLVLGPGIANGEATLYGAYANTHINLGFSPSITGLSGYDIPYCTISGGESNIASGWDSTVSGGGGNEASGIWSTVGGGQLNTASGDRSTVGGGERNTAGGDYSWAGGRYMQLTSAADHTFVWGYADEAQSIATADAFLIFPAGTSGRVGIGTKTPAGRLDVNGSIYQRGSLLVADYVFEPDYRLETIEEHADFMWKEKHLKAIPPAQVDEEGKAIIELGSDRKGIVEELEKAHIYIEQLQRHIKTLESRMAELEAKRNQ